MDDRTDMVRFGGYIPPNVIGYAETFRANVVMWRTGERIEHLIYSDDCNIPDGDRIIPGLVWLFGTHLSLYAYKEWKGEETELYKAPFYNVSKEDVCLGTAGNYINKRLKRITFKNVMEVVEKAFFNSRFTHAGAHDKQINGNFSRLMEKTLSEKEYPYEYLVPINKTVADIANKIFTDDDE